MRFYAFRRELPRIISEICNTTFAIAETKRSAPQDVAVIFFSYSSQRQSRSRSPGGSEFPSGFVRFYFIAGVKILDSPMASA
jgi:hypothetical protein